MIASWLLGQAALLVAAVVVAGTGAARRIASAALVFAGLALPWLADGPALLRAAMACMGLLALVKSLQAAVTPWRWRGWQRAWHAIAPFDVDRAQPVQPFLDGRLSARVLTYAAVASTALLLLPGAQEGRLVLVFLRQTLAVVIAYCGMEAITGTVLFVHLLAGVRVPPLQVAPIAARSVSEFRSRRWNRPVSSWLNHFIFLPVSRRSGPVLALVATFLVSALLHAWMFLTAAGLGAAWLAGAFFLVQARLVLLEFPLSVSRWPSLARHAWTLSALLISAPLFTVPMLRVLGV